MLFQNSQGLGATVGKHLDSLQRLPLLTRHEIPAAASKMKECVCFQTDIGEERERVFHTQQAQRRATCNHNDRAERTWDDAT